MSDAVHRRIGAMNARVNKLESNQRTLRTEVSAMRSDVREIRDAVLHARGAWRMLLVLGGVVAAVASGVATFFGWLIQRSG